jgi:hypothetical protein
MEDDIRAVIKKQLTANPEPHKKQRPKYRHRLSGSGKKRMRCSTACWPIYSDAMGVNPEQIPEAIEKMEQAGVKMEYTGEGEAILTGPAHRKAAARVAGLFDRNGGYGDPMPQ